VKYTVNRIGEVPFTLPTAQLFEISSRLSTSPPRNSRKNFRKWERISLVHGKASCRAVATNSAFYARKDAPDLPKNLGGALSTSVRESYSYFT